MRSLYIPGFLHLSTRMLGRLKALRPIITRVRLVDNEGFGCLESGYISCHGPLAMITVLYHLFFFARC